MRPSSIHSQRAGTADILQGGWSRIGALREYAQNSGKCSRWFDFDARHHFRGGSLHAPYGLPTLLALRHLTIKAHFAPAYSSNSSRSQSYCGVIRQPVQEKLFIQMSKHLILILANGKISIVGQLLSIHLQRTDFRILGSFTNLPVEVG